MLRERDGELEEVCNLRRRAALNQHHLLHGCAIALSASLSIRLYRTVYSAGVSLQTKTSEGERAKRS